MRWQTKQIKRILAKLTILLVALISLCHVEDMANADTMGQAESPVAMGLHGTTVPQKGLLAEHMQCNLLWNINEPCAVSRPQVTNARNPFGQASDDWPLSCSTRPEIHPPQPLAL